jgi:hypothetical protein
MPASSSIGQLAHSFSGMSHSEWKEGECAASREKKIEKIGGFCYFSWKLLEKKGVIGKVLND